MMKQEVRVKCTVMIIIVPPFLPFENAKHVNFPVLTFRGFILIIKLLRVIVSMETETRTELERFFLFVSL